MAVAWQISQTISTERKKGGIEEALNEFKNSCENDVKCSFSISKESENIWGKAID